MKGRDERHPYYPVFKGLQRPLEFFGLQGRYIYWAATTAGGAIAGFIVAYCLLGFVAGLVVLVTAVGIGTRLWSTLPSVIISMVQTSIPDISSETIAVLSA